MRSVLLMIALATTAHADREVTVKLGSSIRARAQTRTRTVTPRSRPTSDEDKARAALAVIDGATWIDGRVDTKQSSQASGDAPSPTILNPYPGTVSKMARGVRPQQVDNFDTVPVSYGYYLRRPDLAYGLPYVVDHLRHCVAEVRALYPDVHTLAIGDLSAQHGGKLAAHKSHQSGLDVDVGFYFTKQPEGYPEHFAAAGDTLDLQATWALITAFARTTDLDDGVAMMFLDYALQRRLYLWAHKRGTPEADLEHLFQYPHGKDAQTGLIRHWPNHADHVHVRFKSRR